MMTTTKNFTYIQYKNSFTVERAFRTRFDERITYRPNVGDEQIACVCVYVSNCKCMCILASTRVYCKCNVSLLLKYASKESGAATAQHTRFATLLCVHSLAFTFYLHSVSCRLKYTEIELPLPNFVGILLLLS